MTSQASFTCLGHPANGTGMVAGKEGLAGWFVRAGALARKRVAPEGAGILSSAYPGLTPRAMFCRPLPLRGIGLKCKLRLAGPSLTKSDTAAGGCATPAVPHMAVPQRLCHIHLCSRQGFVVPMSAMRISWRTRLASWLALALSTPMSCSAWFRLRVRMRVKTCSLSRPRLCAAITPETNWP